MATEDRVGRIEGGPLPENEWLAQIVEDELLTDEDLLDEAVA
jgi:hypothetical protein